MYISFDDSFTSRAKLYGMTQENITKKVKELGHNGWPYQKFTDIEEWPAQKNKNQKYKKIWSSPIPEDSLPNHPTMWHSANLNSDHYSDYDIYELYCVSNV